MIKFIILKFFFVLVTIVQTGRAAQLPSSKSRQFARVQGKKMLISLGLGTMLAFSPISMDAAEGRSEPSTSQMSVKYTMFYRAIYVSVLLH